MKEGFFYKINWNTNVSTPHCVWKTNKEYQKWNHIYSLSLWHMRILTKLKPYFHICLDCNITTLLLLPSAVNSEWISNAKEWLQWFLIINLLSWISKMSLYMEKKCEACPDTPCKILSNRFKVKRADAHRTHSIAGTTWGRLWRSSQLHV